MTTAGARGRLAPGPEIRRFVHLTWTLAVTDWKLRFYGSVLGYFWMLARPFAFFGVVYVVFTRIADIGSGVRNYGVYVLLALVLFGFFSEVTSGALTSLTARESLLRKMRFPRLVIPLSVTLTALLNLGTTLAAVFVFAIATGVYPSWSWLELPLLVGLLAILGTGIGMLLSVLFVRYRDIQPIWEVGIQMLFYASPVLYVATQVPSDYLRPYLANPLAAILTEMRHAIVDPSAAGAAEAIGGTPGLLVPLGVIAGTFALGMWAFSREAPQIAERL